MKPTQYYEVIAWAKKSEFSDDEIETCFDKFILLAELAYKAGRKDENEACALICDHEMDSAIKQAMQIAAGNCADKIRARGDVAPQQREWQGLTDDDVADLRDNTIGLSDLILAVEAKLKEKNSGGD